MSLKNEISIECPKCQSLTSSGKQKLEKSTYNPEKDVFHCFLCGHSQAGLPDEKDPLPHEPMSPLSFEEILEKASVWNDQALEYLDSRLHLSASEALKLFSLGYSLEKNAIVIPSYQKGKLIGLKYRHLPLQNQEPSPRYTSAFGSRAGLYQLESIQPQKTCLLVEGEFDAMSARLAGFKDKILATTNKLSQQAQYQLKKEFQDLRAIYVILDRDIPGQQLLESVYAICDRAKVIELELPEERKDFSEFYEHARNEARGWMERQLRDHQPAIEKATSRFFDEMEKTIEFLSNKLNISGDSSGFQFFDDRLGGGFRPHELTLINAVAKVGKTTFATQLMLNLLRQSRRVGFASLEMDPITQIKPSMLSMALKKNIRMLPTEEMASIAAEALEKAPELDHLFFFNRYGVTPAREIEDWISFCFEEKGVTHFFLDHVGYSLNDQSSAAENAMLAKTLKALTRKHPIHIYAIVQPPKLVPNFKGEMPKLGKDTLCGGASWGQAMDNLITLQRCSDNTQILELRLTDSRFPLSKPGTEALLLAYDRETCSLSL